MTLLSRLEVKESRMKDGKSVVGRQLQGRMLKTVVSEMEERVKNSYRLDKSGTYHILDNFLTSEHVLLGRNEYDVSIVTQSSSNHLDHLVELSQRWNGPISVSVFTYDDDFINTVTSLVHFHFCNDNIYRHVSFHLVYPISRTPKQFESLSDLKLSCHDYVERKLDSQSSHDGSNYANRDLEYPSNVLRNLAINYAQTPYIFVIDIDFLPSSNLRTEFQRFMSSSQRSLHGGSDMNKTSPFTVQQHQSLSAFVVPAFEMLKSVKAPSKKAELLELWRKGLVRPFYWELCQKCQGQTSYDTWRELGKEGPVRIGFNVVRNGFWEPFYIAKTSVPLYDERFKQYGYNRVSQVCEMHVAGFQFHVLDNTFIVHKGFKVKDGFHASKDAENGKNKLLFEKFKEELTVKYPKADRRC
jgi:hypothetical protein